MLRRAIQSFELSPGVLVPASSLLFVIRLHGAIALENRAFVDDEFARAQVADQAGLGFEYDLFLAFDVADDLSRNRRRPCDDFAFDFSGRAQNEHTADGYRALEITFHAEVMLDFDVSQNMG